jgi:hypothetical protein
MTDHKRECYYTKNKDSSNRRNERDGENLTELQMGHDKEEKRRAEEEAEERTGEHHPVDKHPCTEEVLKKEVVEEEQVD